MKFAEAKTEMVHADDDDDFEPAARRPAIGRKGFVEAVDDVKKLKAKQVPLSTQSFGESVRASYLKLDQV